MSFDSKLWSSNLWSSDRITLEGLAVRSSQALRFTCTRSCCRSLFFSLLSWLQLVTGKSQVNEHKCPHAYDDRKSRAFHTPLKFQIRAFVKCPYIYMLAIQVIPIALF